MTIRTRTIGALAALGVATAALLATASPASAHATIVSGTATCDQYQAVQVSWSVGNDYTSIETATDRLGQLTIAAHGTAHQAEAAQPSGAVLVLSVTGRWADGFTTTNSGSVTLPTSCGSAQPPTTTPPATTTPPPVVTTTAPPTTTTPTTVPPSTTVPPVTTPGGSTTPTTYNPTTAPTTTTQTTAAPTTTPGTSSPVTSVPATTTRPSSTSASKITTRPTMPATSSAAKSSSARSGVAPPVSATRKATPPSRAATSNAARQLPNTGVDVSAVAGLIAAAGFMGTGFALIAFARRRTGGHA